jgi:hypothetical protein
LQLEANQLSTAAQLAVVILNITAVAEVAQAGVFRLAISLLAARLQRIAIHLNVGAGLAVGARRAVIAVAISIVVLIAAAICIAVVAIPIIAIAPIIVVTPIAVVTPVAIISARARAVSAAATEVSVQVLDFSAATIKVTEFSVAPVATLVLTGGT